jgi:hypothetical protein
MYRMSLGKPLGSVDLEETEEYGRARARWILGRKWVVNMEGSWN